MQKKLDNLSFFGSNVKKIRQAKGLSQKAFADLFDLSRGVISSYEEGRAEPKIETILKVANHFNLSLDKLLIEAVQVHQLANVSDINQLMLFPELAIEDSDETKAPENNIQNTTVLQKILASVDWLYEFTTENQVLSPYQYGDILFLNKADVKSDLNSRLLVHTNGCLQYAVGNNPDHRGKQELYKIVGYVSTAEKNIFESIFERLEKLERNIPQL
ncbi:helix-turn-helix transcriptional regulator [Chryseobacterium sp. Bi04]|uniref:helix-turn-helix domain-containing protein n=1 Tax=Chryseobacterium sp. Bi04 TaxID=2822345 RepID=UPI001E144E0E|nr:helix-turn-helix transcriptional regulator [Chryseobacterium sp. Bi04]CAH0131360.1 hypothetical protein SRABI04_00296 [Chryseobacterium sp. Bi04]